MNEVNKAAIAPRKTFPNVSDGESFDITNANWAKIQIQALTLKRFWGKATLTFEDGKVVLLTKTETMKP